MNQAPSKPVRCELDSLFELAPDLLVVSGTDGRLARTNPAWGDTLGWDAAALSERPFIDLVHPADQERTLAVLANVDTAGYEIVDFEHRLGRREGGWRWVAWNARSDGERWYATGRDITERRRIEARIFEDPVTRLPTRAVVIDRLNHARARQARAKTTLAVLHVDLDGFRTAQNTFGQATGNRLLKAAGLRLRDLMRGCDTVARRDRDEFVLIAEDVGEHANAEMLANRIVQGFREPLIHADRLALGASVGVAVAGPERWCTSEELLREASTAVERAKDAGGACAAVFGAAAAL